MPDETREQHVARLRELSDLGRQRKLTATELWEVSRRCAEIGDLTKSRQAAERAKALDDLAEQARSAVGRALPSAMPRSAVQEAPDRVTPWTIAQGIIMVPVAIILCIVVYCVAGGLASEVVAKLSGR